MIDCCVGLNRDTILKVWLNTTSPSQPRNTYMPDMLAESHNKYYRGLLGTDSIYVMNVSHRALLLTPPRVPQRSRRWIPEDDISLDCVQSVHVALEQHGVGRE